MNCAASGSEYGGHHGYLALGSVIEIEFLSLSIGNSNEMNVEITLIIITNDNEFNDISFV